MSMRKRGQDLTFPCTRHPDPSIISFRETLTIVSGLCVFNALNVVFAQLAELRHAEDRSILHDRCSGIRFAIGGNFVVSDDAVDAENSGVVQVKPCHELPQCGHLCLGVDVIVAGGDIIAFRRVFDLLGGDTVFGEELMRAGVVALRVLFLVPPGIKSSVVRREIARGLQLHTGEVR